MQRRVVYIRFKAVCFLNRKYQAHTLRTYTAKTKQKSNSQEKENEIRLG